MYEEADDTVPQPAQQIVDEGDEHEVEAEESKQAMGVEDESHHHAMSMDRTAVIITRANVPRLTPVLMAPTVTRCPSITQFSFFDLSNDAHVAQLCQRLEHIQSNADSQ